MSKQNREKSEATRRSREELANHFMRIRLQEADRKAQEYARTLDPRDHAPG